MSVTPSKLITFLAFILVIVLFYVLPIALTIICLPPQEALHSLASQCLLRTLTVSANDPESVKRVRH